MSQINKIIMRVLLLVTGLLLIVGCGDPNPESAFDADSGTHLAGWLPSGHVAPAEENASTCAECHGSDLSGGISGVSCASCHVNGSPLTLTGCTSCHGNPPTGAAAPNRGGAHAAHYALPNMATGCDTCHSGAGTGAQSHFNGAVDVQFLTIYRAKSGAAMHNADGTCSKVSCHGGQTTPVWLTGTINVNNQCTLCHSSDTAEYNSYFSGRHDLHVDDEGFTCNVCHDVSKLVQDHFTSLNTTAMEGSAAATLQDYLNYSSGSCTPVCHETRSW